MPPPTRTHRPRTSRGALAHTADVLERLAQLPNEIGIKESSWEAAAYEANLRLVSHVTIARCR